MLSGVSASRRAGTCKPPVVEAPILSGTDDRSSPSGGALIKSGRNIFSRLCSQCSFCDSGGLMINGVSGSFFVGVVETPFSK